MSLLVRSDRTSVNSDSVSVCTTVSTAHTDIAMAESEWDTVTVLRKKGPSASQSKSKQVSESGRPCGSQHAAALGCITSLKH